MKILVLIPDPAGRGGVVGYYNAIRPHMSPHVEFFVRGARFGGSRGGNSMRYLADYFRFAWKLLWTDYDLVHFNTSLGRVSVGRDTVFLAIARLLRQRTLVFFRGWNPQFAARLRGLKFRVFEHTFLRTDGCVVLASAFAEVLRAWGFDRPIYVETTAVADDLIHAERPGSSGEIDGATLLYLSRVEEGKGVFSLLSAFARVKARKPNLRLVIAGDGGELGAAQEYAAFLSLEDVEFLGHVSGSRKREAFGRADLFVLPTRHAEGMPNAVLEAMACGLPVITRPVGGIRDFFEHGRMGLLVEDTSVEALASSIDELASDARRLRQMGTYNSEYATRFSAGNVARRLETIYADLIAGTTRNSELLAGAIP